MTFGPGEAPSVHADVATLGRHIGARVLNCSATGCLLETTAPIPVGAAGRLRVSFEGQEFDDIIQIVRCEYITSAAPVYHVATKFILAAPPYLGSLRYAMRGDANDFAGWLDTKVRQ